MNIVLASDNNYVQHCSVTMLSILNFNQNVHFFLLTDNLSDDNITYLTSLVNNNGGILDIKQVPEEVVREFPLPKLASSHLSIATYYRLLITSLLDESIDKVIYLDCDMVIIGSLCELWDIDMTGYALGAVYQDLGWSDYNLTWWRLNIPRNEGYFNAGTLLMNLSYLREIKFQNKAIQYIKSEYKRIISHDQDVLNALLYNVILPLSPKWNYSNLFLNKGILDLEFPKKYRKFVLEKTKTTFTPIVIHFVSKPKPWEYGCKNPYVREYYKYIRRTKWFDYKPKFKLIPYIKDVIKPHFIRFILNIDIFHLVEKKKKKIILKYVFDK